jgi:hypothetical protein
LVLDETSPGGPRRDTRISRRNLLRLGAAGLVAVASAPFIASNLRSDVAADEQDSIQLPIGFATHPDPDSASALVSAHSLSSGDPGFHTGGAVVKVRGFCDSAGVSATASIERLSLDVSFEPFHDALFHAWYYSRAAQTSGSPIAVPVPIDPGHGLTLVLEFTRSGDTQPVVQTINLSTGDGSETPKLRAGHYFVSLQDPSEEHPDWGDFVVQHDDSLAGEACFAQASSPGDDAPHAAPFLVLAVDFPDDAVS